MADLNEQIAELLGWTEIRAGVVLEDQLCGRMPDGGQAYLPDWSGDLNLMHSLEEGLNTGDRLDYCEALGETCKYATWPLLHATASQKAQAWIKVKGQKSTPPPTLFRESKNPPR